MDVNGYLISHRKAFTRHLLIEKTAVTVYFGSKTVGIGNMCGHRPLTGFSGWKHLSKGMIELSLMKVTLNKFIRGKET
jgi:hypothetical protein